MLLTPNDNVLTQLLSLGSRHIHHKEELLYMEGDNLTHVHLILDGVVKLYRHDSKSNEVILGYLQPYDLLGEIDEENHYQESAEAETKLDLLKIAKSTFQEWYSNDKEAALFVIKILQARNHRLRQMSKVNITANTAEKVAMFIYEHERMFCSLKQYQVAAMLNVAPETLSRTLRAFKDQGILRFENKRPIVEDRSKLQAQFDFPYYGS